MKKQAKHSIKRKVKNKKIILLPILIIIMAIAISMYIYNKNNNILNDIVIDETYVTSEKTQRMLQVEELKKENEDIIGWLEIANTSINFPVLQGIDNEYYMTHTYNKEYSKDGSIFLDKDYNWESPSSNLLLYGHNNKNGNMFQGLLEYKEDKSTIEIKNKLMVGDTMEIIIPNRLKPKVFEIEKLWDYETEEQIDSISPGVKGQKVLMKLPIKCEEGWILRRKKRD